MKPLPAQTPHALQTIDVSSAPTSNGLAAHYSTTNRRSTPSCVPRIYPWLLVLSTAVAAAFCLLYITKPVMEMPQPAIPAMAGQPVAAPPAVAASAKPNLMMPAKDRLPGETATQEPAGVAQPPVSVAAFEQSNLRVQHILTAEAPGGHLAKIDLDVPVLYQSRNLRWTATEVARARELLIRLSDYQEKTRVLRAEGSALLSAWNQLIEQSIPAAELRADSPTLPSNQRDTADVPRPAGLDTHELIQIQPAAK
ncbi:hypothetical protein HQ447_17350 [bacterium]|nr:hypothetical protein [bacterium]